ncbi:TPA: TFIIB-type zinc ribbon-containing protein [Candidatus Ventrenecus stercoripullorum]|nr:TFIIB-type zinc ribbon-containing protein [Candidatus Ventrenecus stercoripullorum]
MQTNDVKIVKTDDGAKDGQNKCPKCGATDISLNVKTGKLRCNFCRHEFNPEQVAGLETDISKLQGEVIGSGAQNIVEDAKDIMTLKCSSCGAEVVIDTASATQARCHWCRNTLSINEQIPNGAIPDAVLPFKISKEEARTQIESFVKKRKFFAHPKFKEEFTTENIMGVYFPYMMVDINAHAYLSGEGERLIRSYTRRSGNTTQTYYDADVYYVEREFDVAIDDLTVESSKDRLNKASAEKTNNVINAIMPFDTENCVKFNANYLKGYTSEKRDTNTEELSKLVETQAKDIARFAANDSLKQYNRGVAWQQQNLSVKGRQWASAYLPVWLYSYQQVSGNKKVLHYVAVNARTKETMGSVPIHMPKLIGISLLVEILGVFLMLFVDFDYNYLFLTLGVIFFFVMYGKYRNVNARHEHEKDTKTSVTNLRKVDQYKMKRTGLRNSRIAGANNTGVGIQSFGADLLNSVIDSNVITSTIKDINNKNGGK